MARHWLGKGPHVASARTSLLAVLCLLFLSPCTPRISQVDAELVLRPSANSSTPVPAANQTSPAPPIIASSPLTFQTNDYFLAHYPSYTFNNCVIVGMHAIKDPRLEKNKTLRPRCLVRAGFEENDDPVAMQPTEGKASETEEPLLDEPDDSVSRMIDDWSPWRTHPADGCRALYLEWREGSSYGCMTYGHIVSAALNRVPNTTTTDQPIRPNIAIIGNPDAKFGFNGGPYLDPYDFPDLVSWFDSSTMQKKNQQLIASLQQAPKNVVVAIAPPKEAIALTDALFPDDDVVIAAGDNGKSLYWRWRASVTQSIGPWNQMFTSKAYMIILWLFFAITAIAIFFGLYRVIDHLYRKQFDPRGSQTMLLYVAFLAGLTHMAEILIVYFDIDFKSQSHALANFLLTFAFVGLMYIYNQRLHDAGLNTFYGAWFFIGVAIACAVLTGVRTAVTIIGAPTQEARTQAKLLVRLLLSPTQVVTAVGLVVFALRFYYAGGRSAKRRMSKPTRVSIRRVIGMSFLGAFGLGILTILNAMAVQYDLLAEKPLVLISYYCARYLSSLVRVVGLLCFLRLDPVKPTLLNSKKKRKGSLRSDGDSVRKGSELEVPAQISSNQSVDSFDMSDGDGHPASKTMSSVLRAV